jgi:hypothetical protein
MPCKHASHQNCGSESRHEHIINPKKEFSINMSEATINLISPDEIKYKYLKQYDTLCKALEETINVLKALGVNPPPISFAQATSASPKIYSEPQKKLTALVKEACENQTGEFSRDDVLAYISLVAPERASHLNIHSVSAMISNMCRGNGFLELIHSGTGGALSRYKIRNKDLWE